MSSEDQQALRLRLVYFMRPFLFVTLFASLLIPTVAKAETFWLLAGGRRGVPNTAALVGWTVPMSSLQECEAAGQKLIKDTGWRDKDVIGFSGKITSLHYTCVKGK